MQNKTSVLSTHCVLAHDVGDVRADVDEKYADKIQKAWFTVLLSPRELKLHDQPVASQYALVTVYAEERRVRVLLVTKSFELVRVAAQDSSPLVVVPWLPNLIADNQQRVWGKFRLAKVTKVGMLNFVAQNAARLHRITTGEELVPNHFDPRHEAVHAAALAFRNQHPDCPYNGPANHQRYHNIPNRRTHIHRAPVATLT